MLRFVALLALSIGFSNGAIAKVEYSEQDLAREIVSSVVLPAYDQLAEAASTQSAVWANGCSNVEALKAAYQNTADAWAAVFNWTSGPASLLLRRERFYYWPERKNEISRAMRRLMATEAPEKLEEAAFAKTTVAVQGLPALERLLFEGTDVSSNAWACSVGKAIVGNLNNIATGLQSDWQGSMSEAVEAGKHPIYFETLEGLLSEFYTELLTGYSIVKDQKVLSVMGSSAQKARPMRLEARRSGRFEKNLGLNLAAMGNMEASFAKFLPDADAKALTDSGAAMRACVADLPPFAEGVYDDGTRAAIMACMDKLTQHRAAMADNINRNLGLQAGFNRLDGD